ncbi:Microsomal glutathione S-transferase 3 [Actinomortierella ambigua]|nr:Microsomal glutathione S-transferase 3 [Actinomortierella ambigua]
MPVLHIAPEYGYVILSAISTGLFVTYLGVQVGNYRKVANVPLPIMYAEASEAKVDKKKHIFNCYQRAHQNTLELYQYYLVLLLVGGLYHPLAATAGNALWIIGRFFYARGYQTGDPKARGGLGMLFHLGELVQMGLSGALAYKLLTSA